MLSCMQLTGSMALKTSQHVVFGFLNFLTRCWDSFVFSLVHTCYDVVLRAVILKNSANSQLGEGFRDTCWQKIAP